jgi:hypothetical protein
MRRLLASLVLAIGVCGIVSFAAAQAKPNILFIMGDDIGWNQASSSR